MPPAVRGSEGKNVMGREQVRHAWGAVMLWGAVLVAGAGFWLTSSGRSAGIAVGVFALFLALAGAVLKKRYCPRCRDDAPCDLEKR